MGSCGTDINDGLTEVDMKKDLSVQITYRQISYDSIISYKDGILHLRLMADDTYPDGIIYEVTASDIVISYGDITKTFSNDSFSDSFIPKLLYGFFSSCGESLATEKRLGEGSCVERNINGNSVCFQVESRDGDNNYSIDIK